MEIRSSLPRCFRPLKFPHVILTVLGGVLADRARGETEKENDDDRSDLSRFHEPFLSLHPPGEPDQSTECAQINQGQPCWIVTGLSRYHELEEGGSNDKNPDHSGNQGQPMSYPPTGAFCPPAHQQHAQQIHS